MKPRRGQSTGRFVKGISFCDAHGRMEVIGFRERNVPLLIGTIAMSSTSAQSLFELPHQHTLEISPIMAVGVSNALERFRATQQPLENFTVVVKDGEDKEVITVSFVAKRVPGTKGLGSANSMGRGITYRVRRDSGEVVGESFQK